MKKIEARLMDEAPVGELSVEPRPEEVRADFVGRNTFNDGALPLQLNERFGPLDGTRGLEKLDHFPPVGCSQHTSLVDDVLDPWLRAGPENGEPA